MDTKFDLIVVGSGPGGQRAAVQAAKIGKKALVIEKDGVGGSCLHYGTIPSKTLREAVLTENAVQADFITRVMKRKNDVIDGEVDVISRQLARNGVTFVQGTARFVGPHEIEVQGGARYQADWIVLATGTRPRRPKGVPFGSNLIFDSDSLLGIQGKPSSLCVLGAGVIGCEYAAIFAEMGLPVVVVDRRLELLRGVDREIVAALQKYLESKGARFSLGLDVSEPDIENGQVAIDIGGKREHFGALLHCMGRIGNVEALDLANAGITVNARGLVDVNEFFQTAVSHIYAVGDLIGSPALAAAASEQGRLAACHAFGVPNPGFPKFFPYGIYTIPEISSVGAEEKELVEKNIPYVVGRARYSELARGKIMGDEFGFAKLLFHKENRKLLGVHIIGSQATELVHIGQVAMSFGAKVDDFLTLVFNYPTLAEGYKVAGLNAYNQFAH